MGESLQLLPVVETLDLSRNKFAKVDNLHKCTKLKHLDLGFNHLRTFETFSQASCYLVKLVLRNNALTTLRGIENLKPLEGLDVSYNVISNFSELEFLADLPYLQSLWLEGNPLCCARWYIAQVCSIFSHPERERVTRLASIKNDEEMTSICSDEESASYWNEIQNREDPNLSDEDGEIMDLINTVEHMKKEMYLGLSLLHTPHLLLIFKKTFFIVGNTWWRKFCSCQQIHFHWHLLTVTQAVVNLIIVNLSPQCLKLTAYCAKKIV